MLAETVLPDLVNVAVDTIANIANCTAIPFYKARDMRIINPAGNTSVTLVFYECESENGTYVAMEDVASLTIAAGKSKQIPIQAFAARWVKCTESGGAQAASLIAVMKS